MDNVRHEGTAIKRYQTGETIVSEGGLCKQLFVLLRGKVEVLREGVRIATISQKGSYVGEISAVLGCPCTATVRAVEPTEMMYIDRVTEYLEANPQAAYVLAQTLARRIMDMNSKFVTLERLLRELVTSEPSDEAVLERVREALSEMQDLVCAPDNERLKRHNNHP